MRLVWRVVVLGAVSLAGVGCESAKNTDRVSDLQGRREPLSCQLQVTARPEGAVLHVRYLNEQGPALELLKTGGPLDGRAPAYHVAEESTGLEASFIAPRIEPKGEQWIRLEAGGWVQTDYPLSNNYDLTAATYAVSPRLALTVRDEQGKLAFLHPSCGSVSFSGPTLGRATEPLLSYEPDCGSVDQTALAGSQNLIAYLTSPEVAGQVVARRNADGTPHWLIGALFDPDNEFDNGFAQFLDGRIVAIHDRFSSSNLAVLAWCANTDTGSCVGNNAFVNPGGTEEIHFCTGYWTNNPVYRAAVLAHEMSHELFATNDDRYDSSMISSASGAWAAELADPVQREAGYSTLQAYVAAKTWLSSGSSDNAPETTAEHYEGFFYLLAGEHVDDLHLDVLGENVDGPRLTTEVARMEAGRNLRQEFGEVSQVVGASSSDRASWNESEALRRYGVAHGAGAAGELGVRLSLAADRYDFMKAGPWPLQNFAGFAAQDDDRGAGAGVDYTRSDVEARGGSYCRGLATAKLLAAL